MAAKSYSKPSPLPWQLLDHNPEVHTAYYAVDLLDLAGKPTHTLHLYHSSHDYRWRWHITPYKRREGMVMSRHEGYKRRHLAERALMFALHTFLHPK